MQWKKGFKTFVLSSCMFLIKLRNIWFLLKTCTEYICVELIVYTSTLVSFNVRWFCLNMKILFVLSNCCAGGHVVKKKKTKQGGKKKTQPTQQKWARERDSELFSKGSQPVPFANLGDTVEMCSWFLGMDEIFLEMYFRFLISEVVMKMYFRFLISEFLGNALSGSGCFAFLYPSFFYQVGQENCFPKTEFS